MDPCYTVVYLTRLGCHQREPIVRAHCMDGRTSSTHLNRSAVSVGLLVLHRTVLTFPLRL